jgi:hypothetical protein
MDMWDSVSNKTPPPDDKDYPGNTSPRNRPGGVKYEQRKEAKAGERTYEYRLPDGSLQTFYMIATVAKIFGREPVTIRAWEDRGVLPRPRYRTPKPRGKHLGNAPAGRRLYTQDQIDFLVALCERCNMMDHLKADWTKFRAAMVDYPT